MLAFYLLTILSIGSYVQSFGQLQCNTELKFSGIPRGGSQYTPPNTKICFMGDNNRHMSLDVVDNEGCEAVVHAGDFDYWDDAELWMKQVFDVLPDDFPIYVAAGNHDVIDWSGPTGYAQLMYDQLVRSGMHTECTGEIGINQICSYKGILLLGTAVGTCTYSAPSHIDFVNEAFRQYGSNWKVCYHHKNQRQYQVGGKNDETGYAILDACRQHGAIIATGHEHSYSRTVEMSNFQNFTISGGFNPVIRRGSGNAGTTFLFVSGLGGESIREYEADLENNPWWASSASIWECKGFCEGSGMPGAPNVPVLDGVVVCNFNNNGNPNEAFCYFKDVSGRVFDEWYVYTQVTDAPSDFDADMSCVAPYLEFPVNNENDDVEIAKDTGVVSASNKIMTFNNHASIQFTVRNITIAPHAPVHGAWLQMFSASKGYGWKSAPAKVTVFATHNGVNTVSVPWSKEPEDWERHTVWNTEDIKSIIQEIVNKSNYKVGDAITFTVETNDSIVRSVYTLEMGNWFAPTLAVELESPCGSPVLASF